MTMFLDLRAIPSGGFVAHEVTVIGTVAHTSNATAEFERRTRGRNVVLATHGFNVNSKDGVAALSKWDALCGLPSPWEYLGVLWPGDSRYLPVLDYPVEGSVALASGRLLAKFLNEHAAGAANISLVSHSLGARTVLETVKNLNRRVAVLILMAAAIEDDCLTNEYADAMKKVDQVNIIASRSDWVLENAFPIGNLVGGILMHGHPYFRKALGREGPRSVAGLDAQYQLWQIPDGWNYVHGDYLPGNKVDPRIPPPMLVPAGNDPLPKNTNDWKACWSAGVIATKFDG
jgi:pimeloyl-ACP methyl ester carboxylesterase